MQIKSPLTFLTKGLAKIKTKYKMAALEKVWRIRSLFTVGRIIKWDGFGKARWSIKNEDAGILDQQFPFQESILGKYRHMHNDINKQTNEFMETDLSYL